MYSTLSQKRVKNVLIMFINSEIKNIFNNLKKDYPNTKTKLLYNTPFQFLIAVVLSAQTTDDQVNSVTPGLFKSFKTVKELASAEIESVEKSINRVNYFHNKARNIKKTAALIDKQFNNVVPKNREELLSLPGVGRKSANVVLSEIYAIPAITVDTHVKRLAFRIGFTKEKDPYKVELDLAKIWPQSQWAKYSSLIIFHGRTICKARTPNCSDCSIRNFCKLYAKTHAKGR
jgi:endonuclease III